MNESTFDRDAKGQADELQARELGSALADLHSGIDRRKPQGTKPCIGLMPDGTKCGAVDWRIHKGYALCDDCYTALQPDHDEKD